MEVKSFCSQICKGSINELEVLSQSYALRKDALDKMMRQQHRARSQSNAPSSPGGACASQQIGSSVRETLCAL